MSMILELHTVSDASLARVLADPPLVWKVVSPDDDSLYDAARAEAGGAEAGFFQRLFGRPGRTQPPSVDFSLAPGEVDTIDLDKAWHGIHFMLTGTAWEGTPPLNFLMHGGVEIGDVEVGYGPARGMTAAEVKAVAGALAGIDEAFMRARFDPAQMMQLDIYPGIWDRDPADDDSLGYCMEYFSELRAFVMRAAERGAGLVISLT
ncbi:YfbM family protein [Methyloversatilis universalis]|uniref:YfbM family protein n=1 Tax=Methyloversatilis universalis TaxID=378211 RepID=UPI00037987C7|nr:YfbM family protein [Methyloversatilis universalis]